jgi:hypothetical protein
MSTKNYALLSGVIMLIMGCLALVPTLNGGKESLPILYVDASYGLFLDLIPMNIFNKLTLIILGLTGMFSYFLKDNSIHYSKIFSKIVFWFFGTLAILGLFSETNTLSGYWPLFGYQLIINALFSLSGGYFGFLAIREELQHPHSHGLHKVL